MQDINQNKVIEDGVRGEENYELFFSSANNGNRWKFLNVTLAHGVWYLVVSLSPNASFGRKRIFLFQFSYKWIVETEYTLRVWSRESSFTTEEYLVQFINA